MRRLLILVLAVLFLAGCGPKEGLVVDKHYKPDLSYWGTQTSCTTRANGTQSCTTGPHWYYNPPEYHLTLKTPEGDIKDKSVKKKIYYTINIGDYYREK